MMNKLLHSQKIAQTSTARFGCNSVQSNLRSLIILWLPQSSTYGDVSEPDQDLYPHSKLLSSGKLGY